MDSRKILKIISRYSLDQVINNHWMNRWRVVSILSTISRISGFVVVHLSLCVINRTTIQNTQHLRSSTNALENVLVYGNQFKRENAKGHWSVCPALPYTMMVEHIHKLNHYNHHYRLLCSTQISSGKIKHADRQCVDRTFEIWTKRALKQQ